MVSTEDSTRMPPDKTAPLWWQRVIQSLAATRVGSWILSLTIHHLDLVLLNGSGGRVSTSTVLAGLPTVQLTTVGANTGRDRTVPVMGLPDGEKWILVASNWGSESHPAWYHNLCANPDVTLTYRDQTNRYVAREATGTERDGYWRRATEMYVGFEAAKRRSKPRQIPIVVLSPTGE